MLYNNNRMNDTQEIQKKRCPNKTRRNPKTNECEPILDAPAGTTKRCPKKTRRNPRTGECESIEFVLEEEDVPVVEVPMMQEQIQEK